MYQNHLGVLSEDDDPWAASQTYLGKNTPYKIILRICTFKSIVDAFDDQAGLTITCLGKILLYLLRLTENITIC